MGLVELYHLGYGGEKRLCCLVGDHVCMPIPTEAVTKEKETIVVTRGCWGDEALVVNGQFGCREWVMNSGTFPDWLSISLGKTTGCAL